MRRALALATLALAACGKLQGFGGPVPPLVTFNVAFTGDLTPLRPPGIASEKSLQVAVVWGAQWLTEPFCVLPPESDAAKAVIAAGCRDPFGFVPARASASAAVAADGTASLPLLQLPSADVLVGDVTARVAYASLVVYDDRNGNGTLDLSEPHRAPSGRDDGPDMNDTPDATDILYGASFLTMTAPDQRVAYREGAFDTTGFYPRAGCGDPPKGFSIDAASGFTFDSAKAATLAGVLPPEGDLALCAESPSGTLVSIGARAPADVDEVGCDEPTDDGSSRYREPPVDDPDLADRVWACAHLPSSGGFGGAPDGGAPDGGAPDGGAPDGGAGDGGAGAASSLIQLVVSGRSSDRCKGLTHYTLRGCRESVTCALPDWDFTANPPSWWKCPR
ncbi:MAG TPA: hypothetical protein VLA14_10995 [Polyangia bacterium]|nr:hypothetical protein [Polyangia bacterium]